MPPRKKRKDWRNLAHPERFDPDQIDRNILERQRLQNRTTRWRERVDEEDEAAFDPAAFAGLPRGTVINMRSSHHYIRLEETGEVVDAFVRGALKRGIRNTTTLVAPGDVVYVQRQEDGTSLIVGLEPRRNSLSRPDPVRTHLEDVILANVDQVLVVSSLGGPAFWPELVDRYLVYCEYYALEPLLVVNKIDQGDPEEIAQIEALYGGQLGYRLLFTSVETGEGLPVLQEAMRGKASAIVGLSGVGKSSLLNAIQPGLKLKVQTVNETFGGEGKHTTRTTTLLPLEIGGYVADTPGIRAFGLWNMTPEEVDYYFKEFRPLLGACRFANCTHHEEPDCAIAAAIEQGEIAPSRYLSFLALYDETNPAHERPF